VIHHQLSPLKEGVQLNWAKTIIAYEPLWAMGTGTIASGDQTQESCEAIRTWVRHNVGE
jgi:triosephosphate isomerase